MGSFILVVLAVAAVTRVSDGGGIIFIKKSTVTLKKDEWLIDGPAMLDVDHNKALGRAAPLVLCAAGCTT